MNTHHTALEINPPAHHPSLEALVPGVTKVRILAADTLSIRDIEGVYLGGSDGDSQGASSHIYSFYVRESADTASLITTSNLRINSRGIEILSSHKRRYHSNSRRFEDLVRDVWA